MTLTERAMDYYGNQGKNCAVSILLAANETYGLGLEEQDAALVAGFGGGIGCGKLCGCLAGSVAVLGKLWGKREDFRQLCAGLEAEFEEKMGCASCNCADIAPKYKTAQAKCLAGVEMGAQILEAYIVSHS